MSPEVHCGFVTMVIVGTKACALIDESRCPYFRYLLTGRLHCSITVHVRLCMGMLLANIYSLLIIYSRCTQQWRWT